MNELDSLASEVEGYEREHFPVPLPTLAEAMQFRREQMGETVAEIAERAGIDPYSWEILEGAGFSITLQCMRKLRSVGIPAEVLLP